jgi:4-carboxymuconolactone decarboxylase
MVAARLDPLLPESMSRAQRDLYETLATGPRSTDPAFPLTRPAGSLQGPFGALLLSPVIGSALQELGNALRRTSVLTAREREITILVTASHWDCGFELRTHERIGRELGLSDSDLRTLRRGAIPDLADPRESDCALLAQSLTKTSGGMSDTDWEVLTRRIGADGAFELSSIVGYYSTLALQLRMFGVA